MRPLALSQIATWCDARLVGEDRVIHAVGVDTRTLMPGALYLALRGETHDGHDFCARARAAGAHALLVERDVDEALPRLVCADTRIALGQIAAHLAQARATRLVAITGSNGKTTTRTLTRAILAQSDPEVWSNAGNRNNEIGLPLAVIDQPENARLAVYEMGAGAPGDIAYLAAIARPDIALVTNVAPAHLERMGSLLGIADTKAAIYDALPADGIAVINADDAFAPYFRERAGARRVLDFALDASAQVTASAVQPHQDGSRFVLQSPWGAAEVTVPLPGRHQVGNALAAAAVALSAGASLDDVVVGLAAAPGVPGRLQTVTLGDGTVVLDDSYNANPGSVAAAIQTLVAQAHRSGAQAWVALGDMRELGPGAAVLHAEVGQRARDVGVARLLTVGEMSRHAAHAFGPGGEHFVDQTALIERLKARSDGPVLLLVKGSRGSRMDRVVDALAGTGTEGEEHAA
ncbi:UDP-N-acetylmuramoyl-tripeptide--D-alanyl-D-alanine ligase [Denitratimonas tolerans]|uniref:UDP-N-acetylmuramoyl-tripeptide--D-alanyl-D-alanine ligase n=1 Tax=Denitratimonas tolerans TaxID=1338420 RepID=A0AAW9R0W9_9GAMM|nr:UDP-N-acetylmuramoyl-tripeptide--D-alanyl-D-alanine ligase [Xanthomonadaceae bacterium]HMN35008.1 UDP-N-acetylmuramoyl-tripeptide--D-alanyl-D-alanine ligase [Chiayiivirga sp.]HRO86416.1 UDP-N-acetylmuramoyl-tripeptide--D-alanyl-D-alanine ligase [Chiayiivirga sp.]